MRLRISRTVEDARVANSSGFAASPRFQHGASLSSSTTFAAAQSQEDITTALFQSLVVSRDQVLELKQFFRARAVDIMEDGLCARPKDGRVCSGKATHRRAPVIVLTPEVDSIKLPARGEDLLAGCVAVASPESTRLLSEYASAAHKISVRHRLLTSEQREVNPGSIALLTSAPSLALIGRLQSLLGCTTVVDWPTFLLLATVDYSASSVRRLERLHRAFLLGSIQLSAATHSGIDPENAYVDLLAVMLHETIPCADDLPIPPVFCREADGYAGRHYCHFATAVLGLMSHKSQFQLSVANGWGFGTDRNFGGHIGGVAANAMAAAAAEDAANRSRSTSPSQGIHRPRFVVPPAENMKRLFIRDQTAIVRRNNGVWI